MDNGSVNDELNDSDESYEYGILSAAESYPCIVGRERIFNDGVAFDFDADLACCFVLKIGPLECLFIS